MYWNCKVTDFGIKRIAENCFSLKVANFSGCKNLSDKSICVLADNCHNLEVLNLTRVMKISHVALEHISKLPKLRELYLYACNQIDSGFDTLASMNTLTLLELCGCKIRD